MAARVLDGCLRAREGARYHEQTTQGLTVDSLAVKRKVRHKRAISEATAQRECRPSQPSRWSKSTILPGSTSPRDTHETKEIGHSGWHETLYVWQASMHPLA